MKKLNNKGFTIIEVVLVLAMAGLIFLVVFLALPQLQRSRRDTQRRGDAGKVVASLEAYAGNNNGNYPNSTNFTANFRNTYVNGKLSKPDGGNYTASYNTAVNPTLDRIYVSVGEGTDCDGNAVTNARHAVVRVGLEEGVYCQDNR